MHSFTYRANALLTFSVTILAVLCGLASLSDNFNVPSPTAEIQVLNFNRFQRQPNGNDEVSLTLSISADLQSLFTWNTKQLCMEKKDLPMKGVGCVELVSGKFIKNEHGEERLVFAFVAAEYGTPQNSLNQVSMWDAIIPSKEHAKFSVQVPNKYRFVDQGSNLRGKEFNLTLHWHIMPKTGRMFADKIVMTGFRLPESYR